jgi:hypothetical protein
MNFVNPTVSSIPKVDASRDIELTITGWWKFSPPIVGWLLNVGSNLRFLRFEKIDPYPTLPNYCNPIPLL